MKVILRRPRSSVCVAVLAGALVGGCSAQGGKVVTVDLPDLRAQKTLSVTSQSFESQRPISRLFSNYGSNIEPDIRWAQLPNAKSYSILIEDPDAPAPKPFVHWIAFNIQPGQIGTVQSVGGEHRGAASDGVQGKNDMGSVGYFGPHPPIGDEPHHYHFEVFALDRQLGLAGGADRDTLAAAMRGHVLASGEMVATYQER